jgi:hypothetical protein
MKRNNNLMKKSLNTYALFSSMGALYLKEYKKKRRSWYQLDGLLPRPIFSSPLPCDRRQWQVIKARSINQAVSGFDTNGVLKEANLYEASLVEGLAGGWNDRLVQDYELSVTGFAVVDFIPYACLPVQPKAFKHALYARASLVENLKALAWDYPLAGEWWELIGKEAIIDITDQLDEYESSLFAKIKVVSGVTKRNALRELKTFGAKTDYDQWTANYLNNSGQADYENPTHYKHCKQLFKYGVQLIERSLVASRVHLLEEAFFKLEEAVKA